MSSYFFIAEEVMYDFLLKYLMTEDDLVQNGFPRPCPSMAGKAVMKMKKEQSSRDRKIAKYLILNLEL